MFEEGLISVIGIVPIAQDIDSEHLVPMVDSVRRKKLAYYLRQLSLGIISNDTFEDKILDDVSFGWIPEQYYRAEKAKTDDAVIVPMLELCWSLYGDRNQKLKGWNALPPDALRDIARYILFLQSDLEYEWPDETFTPIVRLSVLDFLLLWISLGHYRSQKMKEWQVEYEKMQSSEVRKYWPFIKKEDFEKQLSKPLFLNG